MYNIHPLQATNTEILAPSDKSISHRAVLISALTRGTTEIINFLHSNDTLATLSCIKKLPLVVNYLRKEKKVVIRSKGSPFCLSGKIHFNAGESGTTIRLLSGILAGQSFSSRIDAASSLRRRPMKRITVPLRMMGAQIKGKTISNQEYPPLSIKPAKNLAGITYVMPQASAQVKSSILFASLFSKTPTRIKEPYPSRDHTERMLSSFGAHIEKRSGFIVCEKSSLRTPRKIFVPGDFSSAAFFLVLGTILARSSILIKNAGINPTRTGLLRTLKKMGANIRIHNKKYDVEPCADILVKSSHLAGIKVQTKDIPLMIDEIPILMVAASFAKGTTHIYGLKELKVKETDRIHSMVHNLQKAGIHITASSCAKGKDWKITVKGADKLRSAEFQSFGDHRTAMSLIIFGIASGKEHTIDDITCIDKSFPEFISMVNSLY